VEYPCPCLIDDLVHRRGCQGAIERLDPASAKQRIDSAWWHGVPTNRRLQPYSYDSHWDWNGKCVGQAKDAMTEAVCLTAHGAVQGAMIYLLNAKSVVVPSMTCVYISYLASAPWNRIEVAEHPHISGAGRALLAHATRHSRLLGLQGRVLVASIKSKTALGFYDSLGFLDTGETLGEDRLPFLELSPEMARVLEGI